MPNCLICGADKRIEEMKVIVLSDEERRLVQEPLDEYRYCQPCWKVLSNPVTAPALISGIARHSLQESGVEHADQIADRLRAELTSRAIRKS